MIKRGGGPATVEYIRAAQKINDAMKVAINVHSIVYLSPFKRLVFKEAASSKLRRKLRVLKAERVKLGLCDKRRIKCIKLYLTV